MARFLLSPDMDTDETVANVDAFVDLPDGSTWTLTIVTVAEVSRLLAKWKDTGEVANGSYFWAVDQLIVPEPGIPAMTAAIRELVQSKLVPAHETRRYRPTARRSGDSTNASRTQAAAYVLVEVEKTAEFLRSPLLAQIRTSFGHTAVRWCGAPNITSGQYHVEWTIDEEIAWGLNSRPASETSPALEQGGHCVIVRGRLTLTTDGAAVLDLDGDQILLDVVGHIPAAADGSWMNFYLHREDIALYPYQL